MLFFSKKEIAPFSEFEKSQRVIFVLELAISMEYYTENGKKLKQLSTYERKSSYLHQTIEMCNEKRAKGQKEHTEGCRFDCCYEYLKWNSMLCQKGRMHLIAINGDSVRNELHDLYKTIRKGSGFNKSFKATEYPTNFIFTENLLFVFPCG
ncbi:hypothetical protein TNCV_5025541 [Trichonephila clavipes]|nr:hypothetical protein TNCV_5025541 [Trichonephila clavipes]